MERVDNQPQLMLDDAAIRMQVMLYKIGAAGAVRSNRYAGPAPPFDMMQHSMQMCRSPMEFGEANPHRAVVKLQAVLDHVPHVHAVRHADGKRCGAAVWGGGGCRRPLLHRHVAARPEHDQRLWAAEPHAPNELRGRQVRFSSRTWLQQQSSRIQEESSQLSMTMLYLVCCWSTRVKSRRTIAYEALDVTLTAWCVGSVLVSDTNCMTKGVWGAVCSSSGVPDCSTTPRLKTTTWSAMSNASSCGTKGGAACQSVQQRTIHNTRAAAYMSGNPQAAHHHLAAGAEHKCYSPVR